MTAYAKKLTDPRWQKMRLKVFERDGWKCVSCGYEDRELAVHHNNYRLGLELLRQPR